MAMEEEKEYVLYFYDGRVRKMTGKLSELQKLSVKKIEEASPTLADDIMPMSPSEGPPFPRGLNIRWPWRK